MPNLPEWLLALLTTPDRAAAILGDLTEMAATRGRLWFWTAYTRTLISLGWRTPVAFICAIVGTRFIFSVVIGWALSWLKHLHRDHAWIYAQMHPPLRSFNWILCLLMVEGLCFALPFVLIRFGPRNRLTQLAGALLLIPLPIYMLFRLSPSPFMLHLFTSFSVVIIAVALVLPLWRRPLIVLAATCIPAVAMDPFSLMWSLATVGIKTIPLAVFDWGSRFPVIFVTCRMSSFALAATVCLYLHRRLLRERPAIA